MAAVCAMAVTAIVIAEGGASRFQRVKTIQNISFRESNLNSPAVPL